MIDRMYVHYCRELLLIAICCKKAAINLIPFIINKIFIQ